MRTREEFLATLNEIEKPLIRFYRSLLQGYGAQEILEVGSGWGLFTRSAIEWSKARITTIDKIRGYGLPQFMKNTQGFEDRFERIEGDSHVLLPGWEADRAGRYSIIFVDGDHTEDGAAKDLRDAWPLLAHGGIMLIDDVFHAENWSVLSDGTLNFGVGRALWGFITAHHEEIDGRPEIAPVAHGVVIIRKK